MKKINKILLVLVTAFLVLLLFPNPESNFLAYSGTALFFIAILITLLISKNLRRSNK